MRRVSCCLSSSATGERYLGCRVRESSDARKLCRCVNPQRQKTSENFPEKVCHGQQCCSGRRATSGVGTFVRYVWVQYGSRKGDRSNREDAGRSSRASHGDGRGVRYLDTSLRDGGDGEKAERGSWRISSRGGGRRDRSKVSVFGLSD